MDGGRSALSAEGDGHDRGDRYRLAVLVGAPIFVALEMLADSDRRQEGDSAEAVLMRRALIACPMTIKKAGP
ncbi:MAG: hypothetical protein ABSB76_22570 [Streptosporangiaceae bacterium]|jgi:hypothetical protein